MFVCLLLLTEIFLRRVGVFGALAHARRIVAHTARALEVGKAVDVNSSPKVLVERNSNGRVGTAVIRRLRVAEQVNGRVRVRRKRADRGAPRLSSERAMHKIGKGPFRVGSCVRVCSARRTVSSIGTRELRHNVRSKAANLLLSSRVTGTRVGTLATYRYPLTAWNY